MREEYTFTNEILLPSQREIYILLLGRKGMDREFFLHLLLLNCLQVKIILMPKWRILGWHIMPPFTLHCFTQIYKHRSDRVFPYPKPSESPHCIRDEILRSSQYMQYKPVWPQSTFLSSSPVFLSLCFELFSQTRKQTTFPTVCTCFSLCFFPCYLSAQIQFIHQGHCTETSTHPQAFGIPPGLA